MKKIVCIMVLACLVLSAAFAQKAAFGVDLFQLAKGFIASDSDNDFSVFIISAGFEQLVAPHFSLGIDAALYFIKFKILDSSKDGNYFSVAAEGRYYPMSERFEKFFLGTTLGFNSLSIDGKTKPENGGFQGLVASMKVGYKLITPNKLYLEPSMSYVLSKSGIGGFGFAIPIPLGWNAGLRLGLVF